MTHLHLLYLDNNLFFANQVKKQLESKGHRVTVIDNEYDLIRKIQEHIFDILVIDFSTPSGNAFALLNSLKKLDLTPPPTLLLSDEKDHHLIEETPHQDYIGSIVKAPLSQNFVDQLHLSLLAFSDNPKHSKTEKDHKIQSSKTHLADTTEWQYHLAQETVEWNSTQNQTKTVLPYNEFIQHIHPEDIAHVKTQNCICLFSKHPVEYSFRYFNNQQQLITYQAKIEAKVDKDGMVLKLYGQILTIPPQQADPQNLRLKLSYLEKTPDAVFITDAQRRIISVNDAFSSISGFSKKDVLNKSVLLLNTDKANKTFINQLTKKLKSNPFWQGEVSIRHRNGHSIPVWQSTHILKDSVGNISKSISVMRDLTKQKAYEESIMFQANYDSLTNLPNRSLFIDRLANTIKLSERNSSKFALMLLDLNKFKSINDTLGHHAGDILLQETAKKLKVAVRNSDTVARVGGDEFSIIVTELEKTTDAELIARKVFNSFKQAIIIDQQEIFVSGSIGISIFPADGTDIITLQKNADSAMYKAKNIGLNSYFYYTRAIQKETEKRLKLIDDIRSAMRNKEFSLHYQPIIDVITKKVSSAETLLRWKHPKLGYIPLDDFIPVAEESGLIREIGNWVITEVVENIQRWSELGLPTIDISLNQSVAQYSLSECHVEWLAIIKNKKISTKNITFEISEKIFLEQKLHYLNSIEQLQQEGIQISLDGFGTGYSSLSYLQKFPVDVIKIDRSYTQSMLIDPTYAIFVETIVLLANKLGIKVIATGIENQQQLAILNQQCRYAQGYYFSKPLPINEFEEFIKVQNKL